MTDTTQQQIAARVTPERIKQLMDSLTYEAVRMPNSTTTVATARLPNGFTVTTGESFCVDLAEFNEETGRKLAIGHAATKARDFLWTLEAYANVRMLEAQQEAANP